jgi:cation transport protein ChaC
MPPDATHDLWVFGYGSLMWRPGFHFEESHHARLVGYRRSLCIFSTHYRGTRERPGLVLGLDRGGVCEGVAYRVAASRAREVRDYLNERELIYGVYRPALLPVTVLAEGRPEVLALAFIAERCHPCYAGHVPPVAKAKYVRAAAGEAGCNIDYLANTLAHLAVLGIREPRLERQAAMIGLFAVRGGNGADGARPRAAALAASWRARPRLNDGPVAAEPNRFAFRRKL